MFEVGKVGQHSDNAVKFIPDRVWPLIKENKIESCQGPDHIWKLKGASVLMPSSVSSIKLSEKHSCASDGGSNIQHALYPSVILDFDEYFISCFNSNYYIFLAAYELLFLDNSEDKKNIFQLQVSWNQEGILQFGLGS